MSSFDGFVNGNHWIIQATLSKQFALWVAVFVPGFVISVIVLDALNLATVWIFVAGIAFGEIFNRAVNWFSDWWIVENYANNSLDMSNNQSEEIDQ